MGLSDNTFAQAYTSYSGADMRAIVGNRTIAEVQGVSFSVTREKAPLYTLGSPDPRAFSRGKRGISGSIIFLFFQHSPLPDSLTEGDRQFLVRSKEYESNKDATEASSQEFPEQDRVLANAWYADQIPPFNLLIRASNEYGHSAQMNIFGIEILNTGSGLSVDDITIDESHTYVARRIKRWHNQMAFKGGQYEDVTGYLGIIQS